LYAGARLKSGIGLRFVRGDRAIALSGARVEGVVTVDDVTEALRQVYDPELGLDIVELGLLYDVKITGGDVVVTYSLTSIGCPAGPLIREQILEAVRELPGIEKVELELTWEPPWTPERLSEDAKLLLGFGY
jgi:metal-sulfur cluster biosynthetic enzyme